MQFLGRKSRAVNAVFADASAGHDDHVTRLYFFGVSWFPFQVRGHYAGGAAVNKGFTQEPFIKNNAAVDGGNTAFIAAVFHTFAHAFVNAAWMQNAGRQFLFMKGRSKAKDIRIENQFCAHARCRKDRG